MTSTCLIDDKSDNPKLNTNSECEYFACSVCHELFTFKSNLHKHLRSHFGKKPFKCPICGISLMKKNLIDNHIAVHIGTETYKCNFCHEGFSIKTLLQLHLRRHNPKPISCDSCLRRFPDIYKFQKHHCTNKTKRYICVFCQRSFLSKTNLMVHYRTHTGERPYVCDICQEDFITKYTWKTHCLQHVRNPQVKSKCTVSSCTASKKIRKKKDKITCHVCKKLFSNHTQMNLHLRTHTGENPFTCDVCKQGFSGKFDLFRHLRTHTES